jgi:hypothetical protein
MVGNMNIRMEYGCYENKQWNIWTIPLWMSTYRNGSASHVSANLDQFVESRWYAFYGLRGKTSLNQFQLVSYIDWLYNCVDT